MREVNESQPLRKNANATAKLLCPLFRASLAHPYARPSVMAHIKYTCEMEVQHVADNDMLDLRRFWWYARAKVHGIIVRSADSQHHRVVPLRACGDQGHASSFKS